jgi:hypothetical protein
MLDRNDAVDVLPYSISNSPRMDSWGGKREKVIQKSLTSHSCRLTPNLHRSVNLPVSQRILRVSRDDGKAGGPAQYISIVLTTSSSLSTDGSEGVVSFSQVGCWTMSVGCSSVAGWHSALAAMTPPRCVVRRGENCSGLVM